jgi:hypothetical protein
VTRLVADLDLVGCGLDALTSLAADCRATELVNLAA